MAQIACDLDEEISYTYPMADTTIYITFPCISIDMHIKKITEIKITHLNVNCTS
jgi:hypothetical protein